MAATKNENNEFPVIELRFSTLTASEGLLYELNPLKTRLLYTRPWQKVEVEEGYSVLKGESVEESWYAAGTEAKAEAKEGAASWLWSIPSEKSMKTKLAPRIWET